MLFRIEDVAGFSPNLRSYGSAPEIRLEKDRVDAYIAEKSGTRSTARKSGMP